MIDDFAHPQYQATGYAEMSSKNSWKIEILANLVESQIANDLELAITQKDAP